MCSQLLSEEYRASERVAEKFQNVRCSKQATSVEDFESTSDRKCNLLLSDLPFLSLQRPTGPALAWDETSMLRIGLGVAVGVALGVGMGVGVVVGVGSYFFWRLISSSNSIWIC
jgi:hypothetical protein